jgi:hypothetical protein
MKHAFRLMFMHRMLKQHAITEIENLVEMTPEVKHFVAFISANSKRGVCRADPSLGLNLIGGGSDGGSARPFAEEESGEQAQSAGG